MKYIISLWLLMFLLTATSSTQAKEVSYLCVAESSVGFSFNEATKRWERAYFKTESKYVLSKTSYNTDGWKLKEIGESLNIECEGEFDEQGFIDCKSLRNFTMNNKSLRYIIAQKHGYVVGGHQDNKWFKEGWLTPYLEIGKCSSL